MLDRKERIICAIDSKIISEKSALLNEKGQRTLVLRARSSATKSELYEAVALIFGEKPLAIRTARIKGKPKNVKRKRISLPDWKKAYVKLASAVQVENASRTKDVKELEVCQ